MTLDTTISRAVFEGNGIAREFAFSFRVWKPEQVCVTVTDPDGKSANVSAKCVISVDNHGGTVRYEPDNTPLPVGWRLAITRNMPFVQNIDLVSGTRFDARVVEDGLDVATAERQQILEMIERAVIMPPTSTQTPEDVVNSIYASRDAAAASASAAGTDATAAANSAATAAQAANDAAAARLTAEQLNNLMLPESIGEIRLLPFRANELPKGWYFANGDRFATTSLQGVALVALSEDYKTDWGIREDAASATINVPNLFYSDGRGLFLRSVDGVSRQVGSIQPDALQQHTHTGPTYVVKGESGYDTTIVQQPTTGVTGNVSSSARTANETRPLNAGMTPAIFLGV